MPARDRNWCDDLNVQDQQRAIRSANVLHIKRFEHNDYSKEDQNRHSEYPWKCTKTEWPKATDEKTNRFNTNTYEQFK